MRLAFIGGFAFSPKGTIRSRAHPLAAELVRRGHEVTIFLPPYDNTADAGHEWIRDGVRITNVGISDSVLTYPGALAALIRSVNRYSPDLIHVFKPKGFSGAAATYFLAKNRSQVVLDCDDLEGWGGWNEVKSYPWILKEYIDRQERWMTRSTPVITVASRSLQERANQIRGRKSGVFYVPNCVAGTATDEHLRNKVRTLSKSEVRRQFNFPDKPTVLYAGHFENGEPVHAICQTAARVAERNDAIVLFVGDGPELSTIRNYFSDNRQVETYFLPRLPYSDFLRVVWASDVAVYPYHDDGLHRSKCSARIIDYMIMGKPVITSAVGQNREYIVNGESGILVPPGDDDAFAGELDRLLRDRDLCARIGQHAALRIRDSFSWDGEALRQCLAAYEQAKAS